MCAYDMVTTRLIRQSLVCFLAFALGAAAAMAQSRTPTDAARNKMVDEEIVAAGVKNPRVIEAMRKTPRHEFVPLNQRKNAYFDMALPIGEGQTISPPFVVAYMTEAIDPQPTDKVLEIGTGSGYQAAVLSPLAGEVYTIEIVAPLGHKAAKLLEKLRYDNVHVKVGDGFQGWPQTRPLRQDHRHLLAGKGAAGLGRTAPGRRPDGDSRGRALSADALSVEEDATAAW